MEDMELFCCKMIGFSGKAKATCFEAIEFSKKGYLDKAIDKVKEAENIFVEAHKLHLTLIKKEANQEDIQFSLILMHAEDQLVNAELTKDFAKEIIELNQAILQLKESSKNDI